MKRLLNFDYYIAGIVLALLFMGILMLASISSVISQEKFGNTTHYLFHQLIIGVIPGLILATIAYFFPLKFFKKWAWLAILINLLLMVLVFIPGLGVVAGGASRWINLRFFTFQPSELLKLVFILYIATWLSNPLRKIKEGKKKLFERKENFIYTFVPFMVIASVIAFLLAKQSDLSTLVVIIGSGAIMYFCSGTPLWHILLMLAIGGGGLFTLIKVASYRMKRIMVFLDPNFDPMGIGYQIKQIMIGIGSGGIIGLGLGMSNQKFGFIPQIMSDSIFAIYSEETGLLGSLVLLALFAGFLFVGFRIGKRSKDTFSKLFAFGFSSWICIQAFVNIGAMVGLLPLTGIPLPFISYGGSHVAVELIGVGILLNISKQS